MSASIAGVALLALVASIAQAGPPGLRGSWALDMRVAWKERAA